MTHFWKWLALSTACAALAYGAGQAVAVLLSQRLIGRKVWK